MTPASARRMYRAQLEAHGEPVSLIRGFGGPSPERVDGLPARMLRSGELPVAGLTQGERVLLLLADDVAASALTAPRMHDRVLWNDRMLAIRFVDDATRRVAGELIAYQLTLAGA